MEKTVQNQKAISFGLLLFAGLFLFTPIFAMVDFLPDAFGLFLFVIGLSRICDISDEIANARKLFLDLFLLSLVREVFTILLYTIGSTENAFEVPTLLLLASFVWALLQSLLLIPAFRQLFRGLAALGERHGGEALWQVKRGKMLWERVLGKAGILVILHSIFMTLPEFGALGLHQGESIDEGVYGFINVYRVFAGIPLFVIWILWIVLWTRFCLALKREKSFSDSLNEARLIDEREHPGRAERRAFYKGLFFCGLSLLFFLPARIWDYSIFPGALCAVFAWIGLSKLHFAKKWPFCLSFILVSLARIAIHFAYLIEHDPKDSLYETQASYFYFAVRFVHLGEILLGSIFMILLYRMLRKLMNKRISVVYETGENAMEASRHATEKLQKAVAKKMKIGMLFLVLAALLSIADCLLHPEFSYLWIPATILGAIGLFAFWFPAFGDATDDFVTLRDEAV